MRLRGLAVWGVILLLPITSCSSATPEEQLAGDFCAVVEEYAAKGEDERSVLDVEEDYERLELQGTADGVNFEQVAAKVQLECPDPLAVFLRDQREMVDILDDIMEDLNEEYGLDG